MKEFKKLVLVISMLLMTSCGVTLSTLNNDPIYDSNRNVVEIIENEMQLDRKLRDDFNFRYDYAQYAKSQPISFDWNNRILRNNRFNFSNRYSWNNVWNYSSYLNRDQMWDDWLWGYSSMNNGMGWSYSWNNNSWSSNYWNSPYGWNTYYGWNTGWNGEYGRRVRNNESHNVSRRNTTIDRRAHAAIIQSTRTNIVIEKPLKRSNTTIRRNTTTPTKVYNRIPVNTNRRVNTNNTNRRRVTPSRTNTTTINRRSIKRGNE